MTWELILFLFPGLMIGITLHESAHALSALCLGDGYAAKQGRISLNPFRHLSFWGTLALIVLGFGWGKPVPVNLYNFRHPKRDFLLTSLAGPAANILVCAISLGIVYLYPPLLIDVLFRSIFIVNAMMAVFNLLPIPPLDGSRIWPCLIPGMKPIATGRFTIIWTIVIIYLLTSHRISAITQPVLDRVFRLLPSGTFVGQSRPEGFPLELAAPQDAQASYWIEPEDGTDPNQFTMNFFTEETFPPDRLMTFLRGNLQRQNWTRCPWDPEDPNLPVQSEWIKEEDEDGLPYFFWNEMWFKSDRGLVLMEISHDIRDPNDSAESSGVSVYMEMFTPANDGYRNFMKLHPTIQPAQSP
jgi:Zn-dependent protease